METNTTVKHSKIIYANGWLACVAKDTEGAYRLMVSDTHHKNLHWNLKYHDDETFELSLGDDAEVTGWQVVADHKRDSSTFVLEVKHKIEHEHVRHWSYQDGHIIDKKTGFVLTLGTGGPKDHPNSHSTYLVIHKDRPEGEGPWKIENAEFRHIHDRATRALYTPELTSLGASHELTNKHKADLVFRKADETAQKWTFKRKDKGYNIVLNDAESPANGFYLTYIKDKTHFYVHLEQEQKEEGQLWLAHEGRFLEVGNGPAEGFYLGQDAHVHKEKDEDKHCWKVTPFTNLKAEMERVEKEKAEKAEEHRKEEEEYYKYHF